MVKVKSALPIRKVSGGALGSAVSVLVLWALQTYLPVSFPPEVAAAISGLVSFAVSYWVPLKEEEIEIK